MKGTNKTPSPSHRRSKAAAAVVGTTAVATSRPVRRHGQGPAGGVLPTAWSLQLAGMDHTLSRDERLDQEQALEKAIAEVSQSLQHRRRNILDKVQSCNIRGHCIRLHFSNFGKGCSMIESEHEILKLAETAVLRRVKIERLSHDSICISCTEARLAARGNAIKESEHFAQFGASLAGLEDEVRACVADSNDLFEFAAVRLHLRSVALPMPVTQSRNFFAFLLTRALGREMTWYLEVDATVQFGNVAQLPTQSSPPSRGSRRLPSSARLPPPRAGLQTRSPPRGQQHQYCSYPLESSSKTSIDELPSSPQKRVPSLPLLARQPSDSPDLRVDLLHTSAQQPSHRQSLHNSGNTRGATEQTPATTDEEAHRRLSIDVSSKAAGDDFETGLSASSRATLKFLSMCLPSAVVVQWLLGLLGVAEMGLLLVSPPKNFLALLARVVIALCVLTDALGSIFPSAGLDLKEATRGAIESIHFETWQDALDEQGIAVMRAAIEWAKTYRESKLVRLRPCERPGGLAFTVILLWPCLILVGVLVIGDVLQTGSHSTLDVPFWAVCLLISLPLMANAVGHVPEMAARAISTCVRSPSPVVDIGSAIILSASAALITVVLALLASMTILIAAITAIVAGLLVLVASSTIERRPERLYHFLGSQVRLAPMKICSATLMMLLSVDSVLKVGTETIIYLLRQDLGDADGSAVFTVAYNLRIAVEMATGVAIFISTLEYVRKEVDPHENARMMERERRRAELRQQTCNAFERLVKVATCDRFAALAVDLQPRCLRLVADAWMFRNGVADLVLELTRAEHIGQHAGAADDTAVQYVQEEVRAARQSTHYERSHEAVLIADEVASRVRRYSQSLHELKAAQQVEGVPSARMDATGRWLMGFEEKKSRKLADGLAGEAIAVAEARLVADDALADAQEYAADKLARERFLLESYESATQTVDEKKAAVREAAQQLQEEREELTHLLEATELAATAANKLIASEQAKVMEAHAELKSANKTHGNAKRAFKHKARSSDPVVQAEWVVETKEVDVQIARANATDAQVQSRAALERAGALGQVAEAHRNKVDGATAVLMMATLVKQRTIDALSVSSIKAAIDPQREDVSLAVQVAVVAREAAMTSATASAEAEVAGHAALTAAEEALAATIRAHTSVIEAAELAGAELTVNANVLKAASEAEDLARAVARVAAKREGEDWAVNGLTIKAATLASVIEKAKKAHAEAERAATDASTAHTAAELAHVASVRAVHAAINANGSDDACANALAAAKAQKEAKHARLDASEAAATALNAEKAAASLDKEVYELLSVEYAVQAVDDAKQVVMLGLGQEATNVRHRQLSVQRKAKLLEVDACLTRVGPAAEAAAKALALAGKLEADALAARQHVPVAQKAALEAKARAMEAAKAASKAMEAARQADVVAAASSMECGKDPPGKSDILAEERAEHEARELISTMKMAADGARKAADTAAEKAKEKNAEAAAAEQSAIRAEKEVAPAKLQLKLQLDVARERAQTVAKAEARVDASYAAYAARATLDRELIVSLENNLYMSVIEEQARCLAVPLVAARPIAGDLIEELLDFIAADEAAEVAADVLLDAKCIEIFDLLMVDVISDATAATVLHVRLHGFQLEGPAYYCGHSRPEFATDHGLIHGAMGLVSSVLDPDKVNPPDGERFKIQFPFRSQHVVLDLKWLRTNKPPPLPGGYQPTDKVFFVGRSTILANGATLFGSMGEIVGPCRAVGRHDNAAQMIAVRFPEDDDREYRNCYISAVGMQMPVELPKHAPLRDSARRSGNRLFDHLPEA